jgi:two-component system chemotaxis response regulator CheB
LPGHTIVVVGASAGGIEALMNLVRRLPGDLPAAVFVVVHVPPTATSALPSILERAGALPALHPADGQPIEPSRIYVAPPDHHLLVRPGQVRLGRGPKENGHRPAVDPLFRSAALHYGPRAIGVVLSGSLDDGAAGLLAIKGRGGMALVQDPDEALFPSMPRAAMENVEVDAVLPAAELAKCIVRCAAEPAQGGEPGMDDERLQIETAMAEIDSAAYDDDHEHPGKPSVFGCPDCGGTLWELQDGELLRFRCRVGHAFTAESLLAEQAEQLEAALWAALRALEEERSLAERLTRRAEERGAARAAERFAERARAAAVRAELIRSVLVSGQSGLSTSERAAEPRRRSSRPGRRRPGP